MNENTLPSLPEEVLHHLAEQTINAFDHLFWLDKLNAEDTEKLYVYIDTKRSDLKDRLSTMMDPQQ